MRGLPSLTSNSIPAVRPGRHRQKWPIPQYGSYRTHAGLALQGAFAGRSSVPPYPSRRTPDDTVWDLPSTRHTLGPPERPNIHLHDMLGCADILLCTARWGPTCAASRCTSHSPPSYGSGGCVCREAIRTCQKFAALHAFPPLLALLVTRPILFDSRSFQCTVSHLHSDLHSAIPNM
ncbi:hypothetical protein BC628DRAFT_1033322 [Trametes gibbosa]|nr:hypothetical protein BC628DRAFT_1033322 [Trametes gibbosa]